ncbi:MAG: hypothetical protein ACKO85_07485, partial [Isosphaeraceae bacterium]
VRDVEVRLSQMLGMQVGLEAVRYPRPGEMVLLHPVFRQEEPRGKVFREVARARYMVVRQENDQIFVEASQMALQADHAESAMARLGSLLQKSPSGDQPTTRLNFSVDTCSVSLEESATGKPFQANWEKVAGWLENRPGQAVLQTSGWVGQADKPSRCELKITRRRQGEKATSQVEVATMEGPALESGLISPLFDTAGWFGEKSQISGRLILIQVEDMPWQAEFSGTIDQIDLSRTVTGRFGPHRLSASGRAHIIKAQWGSRPGQGSGWREIQGDLTAGSGFVSHGLLLSMGQQMKFRILPEWIRASQPGETIDFTSIGLQFHLSPDGVIKFSGACGPDFGRDVVATSIIKERPKAIVAAPDSIVTVRGLIKTLFPVDFAQAELLVPSTRESQALQRYLPMPADRPGQPDILPASHQ